MSIRRDDPIGWLGMTSEEDLPPLLVRTINALRRYGVTTVGDLLDADLASFHDRKQVGTVVYRQAHDLQQALSRLTVMSTDSVGNEIEPDAHVCVCGLVEWAHEEHCEYGGRQHTHHPPLCCAECPCESFAEAHPEATGLPLERLSEIFLKNPLSTRTIHLLQRQGVRTMERLAELDYLDLRHARGIGRVSSMEIAIARYHWRVHLRNTEHPEQRSYVERQEASR